jgi:hypothetical protein
VRESKLEARRGADLVGHRNHVQIGEICAVKSGLELCAEKRIYTTDFEVRLKNALKARLRKLAPDMRQCPRVCIHKAFLNNSSKRVPRQTALRQYYHNIQHNNKLNVTLSITAVVLC